MTQREFIDILRRHPRCCMRFGWRIEPCNQHADDAMVRSGAYLIVSSTRWPSPVEALSLSMIVGPLVLWCWERGIEAVRIEGTWQAYTINEEIKPLSGVHAEPWLALLQACEEHEETP